MKFKIKLSSSINSNGLMYNFKVSSDEEVKFDDEDKPFDISHEYMSSILVSGSFKDNITYLHFSIKDQFGNILNEKFKITTKSGLLVYLKYWITNWLLNTMKSLQYFIILKM